MVVGGGGSRQGPSGVCRDYLNLVLDWSSGISTEAQVHSSQLNEVVDSRSDGVASTYFGDLIPPTPFTSFPIIGGGAHHATHENCFI